MWKLGIVLLFSVVGGTILTVNCQTHTDLSTEHQSLTEAAEDIAEEVEDLEDGLDDLEDELGEIEEEIEDFREEVEEDFKDVGAGAGTLENQISTLKNSVETKLQEMGEKLDLTTSQEDLQDVKQDITSLQNDMNSTLYILQELKSQLITMRQENFIEHQNIVASSCSELHPTSPSGYYWLRGLSERVYCDMDRQSCGCGNTWGWMRVANIDMTDPNQQCPEGFRLRPATSPRMCESTNDRGNCRSIDFSTHSVQYSRVCGRVNAYQLRTPDAFEPYYLDRSRTIDDVYVDGVSITHGQWPRKHIWTFAAAIDETRSNHWVCPCTKTTATYTGHVPPFIGNDYFCDTGSHQQFEWRLYTKDPLWDGRGCGPTSSCCQFNSPPWFCTELPQSTTDDIEVRVCSHYGYSNEYTPFDRIELYLQ